MAVAERCPGVAKRRTCRVEQRRSAVREPNGNEMKETFKRTAMNRLEATPDASLATEPAASPAGSSATTGRRLRRSSSGKALPASDGRLARDPTQLKPSSRSMLRSSMARLASRRRFACSVTAMSA